MSHPEDHLVRELRERSQDVAGHGFGFPQVRKRAQRIQRRRQIASGLVTAMALAVAVPTALSVSEAVREAPGHIAAGPTTSPTSDAALARPSGPVPLVVQGIAVGEPAKVPYLLDDGGAPQLITSGESRELPANYQMITPFQDGWLAIEERRGTQVVTLDADMDPIDVRASGGPNFAINQDRTQIAWTERPSNTDDVTLFSAPTQGFDAMTWKVTSQSDVVPLGFLPNGQVVFTTYGEPTINAVAAPDGTITDLGKFLALRDASQTSGLVSGVTAWELGKVCFGVMDPSASIDDLLWERCDYSAERFSPNGQYIFGGTPESDGEGHPTLAILDAQTGDVLIEYKPARNDFIAITNATWEDNDSVIAITRSEDGVSMLRLTTDGTIEHAGDHFDNLGMDLPYWFAEVGR